MIDRKEVNNAKNKSIFHKINARGNGAIDEICNKIYVTVLSGTSRQDDSLGSRWANERRDCPPFEYAAGGCQHVEKTIF
jgi:hypothetical protein